MRDLSQTHGSMLGPSRESAASVPGLRLAALMTHLPFFSGSKLSWEVTLQLVQKSQDSLNPNSRVKLV